MKDRMHQTARRCFTMLAVALAVTLVASGALTRHQPLRCDGLPRLQRAGGRRCQQNHRLDASGPAVIETRALLIQKLLAQVF